MPVCTTMALWGTNGRYCRICVGDIRNGGVASRTVRKYAICPRPAGCDAIRRTRACDCGFWRREEGTVSYNVRGCVEPLSTDSRRPSTCANSTEERSGGAQKASRVEHRASVMPLRRQRSATHRFARLRRASRTAADEPRQASESSGAFPLPDAQRQRWPRKAIRGVSQLRSMVIVRYAQRQHRHANATASEARSCFVQPVARRVGLAARARRGAPQSLPPPQPPADA